MSNGRYIAILFFIAVCSSAHARGIIENLYLLPHDGSDGQLCWHGYVPFGQVTTVGGEIYPQADLPDLKSGMIFRLSKDSLSAYSFGQLKPVYALNRTNGNELWFTHIPDVLVRMNDEHLIGFDKTTGKEIYSVRRDEQFRLPRCSDCQSGDAACCTNGEEEQYLYLANEELLGDDHDPQARRAPVIVKFDLRSGKKVWERAVDQKGVVRTNNLERRKRVMVGSFQLLPNGNLESLERDKERFGFTGQVFSYALRGTSFTAYKEDARAESWTLKDVPEIAGPLCEDKFGRFVYWSKAGFVVIRLLEGKLACSIPSKDEKCTQSEKALFMYHDTGLRAVDPETGKDRWSFSEPDAKVRDVAPAFKGMVVIMLEAKDLKYVFVWLDETSGRELRRWKMPGTRGDYPIVRPAVEGWIVGSGTIND